MTKSTKPRKAGTKAKSKKGDTNGRLRPGELDSLVLRYMRQHEDELPLTASTIGASAVHRAPSPTACLV